MKHLQLLLVGFLISGYVLGQSSTPPPVTRQTFTIAEAQQYAKENSPVLKNANLDLKIAEKKVWETTAMGLPHISGKVSGSYMIEMSPTIEQFSDFGSLFSDLYKNDYLLAAGTGNTAVLQIIDSIQKANAGADEISDFDRKWGANFDLTVSQLVFSGAYLVGLQTTKAFKGMSQLAITKSAKDLDESVSNAYYLVLVMQENKKIMDEMYVQIKKTVTEMEAMYTSGFIEETSVDQIKLTANNLKNTLLVIEGQVEVAKNLLRFQMGYNMTTEIVLTEQLDALLEQNIKLSLLNTDFNVASNTDYKLIQNQTNLKELQLKYQKSMFLPDVAVFYQYDHNFNDNAMSFTPPQLVGASINIPIFGSGDKVARVGQARLDLEKAKNTEFQVSQGLALSYSQAQTTYSSAINKLVSNKESVNLSQRIYDKTLIKFKNGVSSSMELTQAQSQLLQAQSTYYSTIIELVNAKNTLEKLLK